MIDCSAPRLIRDRAHVLLRHVTGLPPAEQPRESRLNLGKRDVAHDDERRVIRLEPGAVEAHQIVTRHARHRLLGAGAGQRVAIGVVRAVEQLREDAQCHLHRLHFLALDAREALPLLPLEIGLRERRGEDHVGEDVERRIEIVFERR